jgi:hypothetical protein
MLLFKIDLESEEERVLPHYGAPIKEFFLELDGEWFEQKDRGAVEARSVAPTPARQRRDLHTRICAREWRSTESGLPMPEFAPGRHTVRVGFPLEDRPDATGQRPRAVSNPVEVVTGTKEDGKASPGLHEFLEPTGGHEKGKTPGTHEPEKGQGRKPANENGANPSIAGGAADNRPLEPNWRSKPTGGPSMRWSHPGANRITAPNSSSPAGSAKPWSAR